MDDDYPTDEGLGDENNSSTKTACKNIYCWSDERVLQEATAYVFPQIYEWFVLALSVLVFVFGLSGNFLVCFSVWKNKHLRTITNLFLVNLAVADFMVLLICLPPTVIVDVTETWFFGLHMCKITYYFQDVSVFVSVQTLAVISVERWSAICHPLTFKETTRRAFAIITSIWLVSVAAAIPNLISMGIEYEFSPSITKLLISCLPCWSKKKEFTYQIIKTIVFFVLPVFFMGLTYTQIALCLWRSTRSSSVISESSAMAAQIKSRQRTAKMLIVVVVVFVLCYLPVFLLNTLRYYNVLRYLSLDVVPPLALTAHWLCHFNSAINPLIYNFMSGKFHCSFLTSIKGFPSSRDLVLHVAHKL